MKFNPGDKARLVGVAHNRGICREALPYLGTEVTVQSHLTDVGHLQGKMGYEVLTHDGLVLCCIPECLERPPKPPHEQKVAWELVPAWRLITAPKKVPVEAVARGWPQPTAALRYSMAENADQLGSPTR